MSALAKFPYIRDEKLMKRYRTIPCQHCGRDDGTVCGAHSNQAIHGHGRGIKASDVYCASLCNLCHYMIDNGKGLSREERVQIWNAAHLKTMAALGLPEEPAQLEWT